MADNNLDQFTQGVASYLKTHIFPPIVQGIAAKGTTVTVDELMQMVGTKTTQVSQSIVPAMAFGGPVITNGANNAGGKRKQPPKAATPPEPVITDENRETATGVPFVRGKTCAYVYKRGDGLAKKFCGKPTMPGSDFCKDATHRKQQKDSGSVMPGAAPTSENPSGGGALDVEPYDVSNGLFKTKTHGFIVFEISEGNIGVIGKYLAQENKIVNLSPEDKLIAQNIGLQIVARNISDIQPQQPVIQQVVQPTSQPIVPIVQAVPSIPTVQAIPSIPTANVAKPSIPVIPTMAVPTSISPVLPTIPPLINGLNAPNKINQIPQIPNSNFSSSFM